MEKLSADVTELPNEIGAYTAALEENLGKNVEKFIKEMYEVRGQLFSADLNYWCKLSC
jgi:hypothetical protein